MNAIVNVDKHWGIGRDGDQPFYIPEDLKFFKDKTLNKVVVMGRATLQALPNSQPLKNRTNIILTRNPNFTIDGAIICHNLDALHHALATHLPNDIFIIGGAEIYETMLPFCTKIYITKIHATALTPCDKFFPNLDEMPNWQLAATSEIKQHEGIKFQFCEYVKI